MQNYCEFCGAMCEKKFYIHLNKTGGAKSFCWDCFNKLSNLSATEINKELRVRKKVGFKNRKIFKASSM